jgi:hypothetical protein
MQIYHRLKLIETQTGRYSCDMLKSSLLKHRFPNDTSTPEIVGAELKMIKIYYKVSSFIHLRVEWLLYKTSLGDKNDNLWCGVVIRLLDIRFT